MTFERSNADPTRSSRCTAVGQLRQNLCVARRIQPGGSLHFRHYKMHVDAYLLSRLQTLVPALNLPR